MADTTTTETLPTFIPDVRYRVQLSQSVKLGRTVFTPGKEVTFIGSFAETVRDSISSARAIADGELDG